MLRCDALTGVTTRRVRRQKGETDQVSENVMSLHRKDTGRKQVLGRLRCLGPLLMTMALPGYALAAPVNVGDAALNATRYHDSGAYERDFNSVLQDAEDWIRLRSSHVVKPAVILDIDETSLSNWPEIAANQFAYFREGQCASLPKGPCGVEAWEQSARAEAFPETLSLYNMAQQHGVSLFFVTGRYERERNDTARNLESAGYHGWVKLVLRPEGSHTPSASDYKSAERARIEQEGYHIIANIGDQPSDLAGGHAERGFLLPNPFYRVP